MTSRLANVMTQRAGALDATQGQNQWGIVVSVDAPRQRVKVQLQPSGVTTSWLPMLVAAAGNGWGMSMLPMPGMQVMLAPDAGNSAHLVVLGAAHSLADPPPSVANAIGSGGTASTATTPTAAGEMVLTHSSGSVVRLCANGDVYIRPSSGTVGIDGTLRVNGDVFDRHGSLDRLRMNYDAHEHTGVSTGVGKTGLTDHQDAE